MKSNDLKEYKRHIKQQKKFLKEKDLRELGELINGEIGLLTQNRITELWMSLAFAVLNRATEYLNIMYCLYGNRRHASFPKTPHLIYKNLNRLQHYLEESSVLYLYEPYCDEITTAVDNLLEGEIVLQHPAYWFVAEDYYMMKDGKLSSEFITDVARELIALESHSEILNLERAEFDCEDIEILALSVLEAIRSISATIDITLVQKRIGYGFSKSKYLITWLAENGYIQKILNKDEEDLGYGIREINCTVEEISEILESKKQ